MKIVSFTGKSGTGKSYQATALAQRRGFDAIIDDGLLIYKGQIVAGTSAKKCASKAAAMRTALFNYEDHRNEVKSALVRYRPETLMIIGTSDRMTNIIAEQLGLHEPDGYFMNPLKFFRDRALGNAVGKQEKDEEDGPEDRTVVRPQFSYFGTFTINEHVIRDIIRIASAKYEDTLVVADRMSNGKAQNMSVTIDVRALKDPRTVDECVKFQKDVYDAIAEMTAFTIESVNVRIRDIAESAEELHSKKLH